MSSPICVWPDRPPLQRSSKDERGICERGSIREAPRGHLLRGMPPRVRSAAAALLMLAWPNRVTRVPRLGTRRWRPEPESNRRARICSPLRNHSAIGPPPAEMRGRPRNVNHGGEGSGGPPLPGRVRERTSGVRYRTIFRFPPARHGAKIVARLLLPLGRGINGGNPEPYLLGQSRPGR